MWPPRRRSDEDFAEEIHDHIRRETKRLVDEEGFNFTDAKAKAIRSFGNLTASQERFYETRRSLWLDDLRRDFRVALRGLRATPIVSTVAVVSLALGIGATTAMFSLVDSVLLRTVSARHPHGLALVTAAGADARAWSYPVWVQLRRHNVFEEWAVWSHGRFDLALRGETQFVDGIWASGTYFDTLGVQPLQGRTFSAADDQPGGGPDGAVCVISHAFWQRHFGGAADAIGRPLTLDGTRYTVIGITPSKFFGMEVGRTFDVALPLELNKGPRGANVSWLSIVGRFRPGQTFEAARGALQVIQPAIREATLPPTATPQYRAAYLKDPFDVVSAAYGKSDLRRQYKEPLLALMAVVGLVMLIACANIANLLLARAAARRHEFGVRLALGASRWRLARQVLAESAVLAMGGTLLGLVFAIWGSRALVRQLAAQVTPQSNAVFLDLSFNWHLLGFTIGAAVLTALLFGVTPALRASRVTALTVKAGRVAGGTRSGVSNGLVVIQLTLSVVLLVAAGLFVRTFASLSTRAIGFTPDRVLVVNVRAERTPVSADQRIPTFERAVQAVRALPSVASAAASLTTPLSGLSLENQIEVPGAPSPARDERGALINHVSPGWFQTLGMRLVAGREFNDADGPTGAPVAVVNEAFAGRFLNGQNPVGHTVKGLPVAGPPVPIVGMTADAIYKSMREPATPTVFLPFAQSREAAAFAMMSVTIRPVAASPESLTRSVAKTLEAINPDLTWTFRPLEEQIDASLTQERVSAIIAGFFGVLALLLAALGLYGVTAYSVSQRRSEIAVRLTLGARPAQIVALVASRVAFLVSIGAVAGTTLSMWLSQFVETLLYGAQPQDPVAIAGAVVTLVAVGLVAGSLPAALAARIQPAGILRET
jgi:predicted permease